jgi:hypothetical protein
LLVALVGFTGTAYGDVMALDMNVSSGTLYNTGDWSLGWSFTVNSPITVTSLDYYYPTGWTVANHDVGIYDSAGNPLMWATVTASDPPVGTAPWHEQSVIPYVLGTGTYYIAGETGTDDYAFFPPGDEANVWTIPQITFGQNWAAASDTLVFPEVYSWSTTWPRAYFGPSFNVPEPGFFATFGALMAGLGSGIFALRRRFR